MDKIPATEYVRRNRETFVRISDKQLSGAPAVAPYRFSLITDYAAAFNVHCRCLLQLTRNLFATAQAQPVFQFFGGCRAG